MELNIMRSFKWIWYIVLFAVFLLVTFFGIGPIVFADGSRSERIITLTVVILLYVILGIMFIRIKNQGK